MAVSKVLERWAFEAAEDLSKKQFFVVSLSTSSTISLASSASAAVFPLEDTPKAGEYGTVVLAGVAKVKAAGEIKAGEKVVVAAAGGGEVDKAGAKAQQVIGTCLVTAPVGTLCTILVHSGSGATG